MNLRPLRKEFLLEPLDLAKKEFHPQFVEIFLLLVILILEPQQLVIQEFLTREGLGFLEFQFHFVLGFQVQVIQKDYQDLLLAHHHLLLQLRSLLNLEASFLKCVHLAMFLRLSTPRLVASPQLWLWELQALVSLINRLGLRQ